MAKVTIHALASGYLVSGEEEAHALSTLSGALQFAAVLLGRKPHEAYLPSDPVVDKHHAHDAPMPPFDPLGGDDEGSPAEPAREQQT